MNEQSTPIDSSGANDAPSEDGTQQVPSSRAVRMKLFGIGGAGMNVAARLEKESLGDIEVIGFNADSQGLSACSLNRKILIGERITRGLGAGGDPEIGARVAESARPVFDKWIQGADVVFLTVGLGGGTGGPAACAAGEAASRSGALVIAFAVQPFSFEGPRRQKQADQALIALRKSCDAVIPLPNDILLQEMGETTPVLEVFQRSDDWIVRGVRSLWSILSRPGEINLDLADLRQVFRQRGGKTLYGLGMGSGERCAHAAYKDMLMCPLLHSPEFCARADHLLINLCVGPGFTMNDVHETVNRITERFGRDGHIMMGVAIDESLAGGIEICVLGTTEVDRPSPSATRHRRQALTPRPAQPDSRKSGGERSGAGGHAPKVAAVAKPQQREFGFEEEDRRGYFDRSESNLYEGEDLDVPTYLRRGIRISP